MLLSIVLATFACAIVLEYFAHLKSMDRRGKLIYFSMMLVSLGVLMLYIFDVHMPSPSNMIVSVLSPLLHP